MKKIGLHLRITAGIADVMQRACEFQLALFQCFLIDQHTKRHISIEKKDIQEFASARDTFNFLPVHGAYWINVSGKEFAVGQYILQRELEIAKRLNFSHYILHPGSAASWKDKRIGIDSLVRILNTITKHEQDITIVLENTAHGGYSIGSNLEDFRLIKEKLDFPEKISFCIDTAHAHAFGYDIVSSEGSEQFIQLLENTVGIEAISLIHLNDTKEKRGSHKDQHEIIGNGMIGKQALVRFLNDSRLSKIPVILELPALSDEEQKNIVAMVHEWSHTKKEK
jgi:deoxyribonuclease-4